MSTPHLIPLIASPQTLSIAMGGVTYSLNVYWCRPAGLWMLDVSDVNNNPIIQGIPLVTGADLLAQYKYAGIGGQLIAQTDNNALLPPDFTSLGSTANLYFVTTP